MRREIIVNGRFLARRVTGVERYGREILQCIGNRPALSRRAEPVEAAGEGYRVESTRRQGWTGHAWEQFVLPAKLDRRSILWSPANTGPLIIRNQALTIHDLSPLEHPEWFRTNFAVWYRLFLPLLARRVQKVFTPSEYVKQKVIKRFGIRDVTVTPNGVDCSVFHPNAIQTRFDLPACYVLFVGTLEPRKNLGMLLRAWNGIKDEFKETWLVIAGMSGNVFRDVNYRNPMERVRFLGYVDDQTLAGLYANATLFVLPSQEEGFGLPALEAMASGTPVIVSNGGALPEVVGEAGVLFNLQCHSPGGAPGRCEGALATDTCPGRDLLSKSCRGESRRYAAEMLRPSAFGATPQHDMNLTNALKECLSDAELRSALKEKGLRRAGKFSWQATAESVWKSLNEI